MGILITEEPQAKIDKLLYIIGFLHCPKDHEEIVISIT